MGVWRVFMHAYVIHGVGHAPQEIFILNHAGLVIEGIYLQGFIQAGSPLKPEADLPGSPTVLAIHCKKKQRLFWLDLVTSLNLLSACIIEHSGVPLRALDSKQIKDLVRLSRTLANVMGE